MPFLIITTAWSCCKSVVPQSSKLRYINLYTSSYSSGWDDRKENIKKIKSNKEYRELRYLFYYFLENFKGFDSEENNSRILEIFEKIKYQHKKYGYEKNTLKLIQSYPEEFSKLFSAINLTDGIKLLIIFDEENKNIYEKYLRWIIK